MKQVLIAAVLTLSSISFAQTTQPVGGTTVVKPAATPTTTATTVSPAPVTPYQRKEGMKKHWNSMDPSQKQHFMKQKEKFQKMDSTKKEQIKSYWSNKSPEQKAKFREKMKGMTPDQRKDLKDKLRKMKPEDRQEYINKMFSQTDSKHNQKI